MELLLALAIGTLFAGGTWLVLRVRTFPVVLGLTLLSYGVNLLLVASGRIAAADMALVDLPGARPDPLPSALVLTSIGIGFATTALLVALALRAYAHSRTEHVDGAEPEAPAPDPASPDASHRGQRSA